MIDYVFEDAIYIFEEVCEGIKKDEKQIQNATQIVEDGLNSKYFKALTTEVLIRYILFKTYIFLKTEKSRGINNIEKNIEQIRNGSYEATFADVYRVLMETTELDSKYIWNAVKGYIEVVNGMKKLRKFYMNKFGEKNNRTVLITAYIGLLETPFFIKEGYNYIDKAFNEVETEDELLLIELQKIKKIADNFANNYSRNRFEFKRDKKEILDISLDDVIKKIMS